MGLGLGLGLGLGSPMQGCGARRESSRRSRITRSHAPASRRSNALSTTLMRARVN